MNFKEDKLKSSLLEEINSLLLRKEELKEIAFVTVTDAEIINKGKSVNIYFSIFGNNNQNKIDEVKSFLDSLATEIRQFVGKRIKTRFIPNLYFIYDPTPQHASRIEEILKKIESEKNNAWDDKKNKSS